MLQWLHKIEGYETGKVHNTFIGPAETGKKKNGHSFSCTVKSLFMDT